MPPKSNYFAPIRADKFTVTQVFYAVDPVNYPITGHHPGVDYGTQGATDVPAYFVTDGEVIESGVHPSFGNYFFFYCPGPDRTFVYFHFRDKTPKLGAYKGGQQAGIVGNTGLSQGTHLHLECMKGRQTSTTRSKLLISSAGLLAASEDADAFIRARM